MTEDGSSRRHRERLLAVSSGLIEQHDSVGALHEARGEAIREYVHGVGIDLGGRTSAKAPSVAGRTAANRLSARPRRTLALGPPGWPLRPFSPIITLRKPDQSIKHDSNDQQPKLYE
jgi:hypothetical protein